MHTIQLRRAWTLSLDAPEANARKVFANVDLSTWRNSLPRGFRGAARLTRNFNSPSGLEAETRVWLAIRGLGNGRIELNGHALGTATDAEVFRSEIRHAMKPGNRLTIDFVAADAENKSDEQGEFAVWLEIEEPARSSQG